MTYNQGFAYWAFVPEGADEDGMLAAAADIGFTGVDFLPEELWPRARDAGLDVITMDGHVPIEVGFIDREYHADLADQVRRAIDRAVAAQVRYVTVASGNRGEQTTSDAISVCVEGLMPLAQDAQAAGVGLLLEPLNTKVDHAGHECDRTAWAAEVVDRVGSPNLKILYDFYHAQIMEGDLLRTVQENLHRIGHFHTAGVPGRHEIDDRQEVNYGAIAAALRDFDYRGYVSHEFIPCGDSISALRQAYSVFA